MTNSRNQRTLILGGRKCLPARLPACLLARLLARLHPRLPAELLAYLSACRRARVLSDLGVAMFRSVASITVCSFDHANM